MYEYSRCSDLDDRYRVDVPSYTVVSVQWCRCSRITLEGKRRVARQNQLGFHSRRRLHVEIAVTLACLLVSKLIDRADAYSEAKRRNIAHNVAN